MLYQEARICQSLRSIVTGLRADPVLQEDLMQECLIRLWKLESEKPGRTPSWYLQNCRFHLQHWLASGRSLDSLKRATGDNRVTIDGVTDELPAEGYHTNGELLELVCAQDLVGALAAHLTPRESALLRSLADGLVLHDIAIKLKLSYPTALKYRRKIASLALRLGIAPPLPYQRGHAPRNRRTNGIGHRRSNIQINGNKRRNGLRTDFRIESSAELNGSPQAHINGFNRVIRLADVSPRVNGGPVPVSCA
jgi:DNA-binding CsgD family transcriptional regulator